MLKHIYYHPALIHYQLEPFTQDTSHDAWFTPYWVRSLLRQSPLEPTMDLFADATNALTRKFCSEQDPFSPEKLDGQDVYFYQPPYSTMGTTWKQCFAQLTKATKLGFWGLVPLRFYLHQIGPALKDSRHCCTRHIKLDYHHPVLNSTQGASFSSILFLLSPSCVCDYLEQSLPTV